MGRGGRRNWSWGSFKAANNALVLALLTCFSCSCGPSLANGKQQLASVSTVDFENVTVGTSSTQVVTVTNAGDQDSTISGATVTAGSFSLNGPAFPLSLLPGQSASLNVIFRPSALGSTTGSLSLLSDAHQAPITILLSGKGVQPLISVVPTVINFGNVPVGVSKTLEVTVSNPGNAGLNITQFAGPGTGFKVSGLNSPLTISPGQSAKFSVSFTPNATGSLTSSIALVSDAPVSPASLSLSGTGVQPSSPQISVTPGNLAFGSVTVGSSGTQSVNVSNTGSASLSITAANVTGSGFSTRGLSLPITVAAGGSGTITVNFAPSTPGSVSGSLSLASNATASPTVITLSGTGVQPSSPQISVTPGNLTFGSVTVGSSGTHSVAISNTGSASLSITAANMTGSGFSILGLVLPLSLSSGQSSGFSVTFAPTAAGSVTGNMSLVSNASGSPTQVGLTGSAVQPPSTSVTGVTISPTNPSVQAGQTIQFSDTVQGTTTNTSVTWTGSAGSITAGGLFTAPSSAGTVTVTVISSADNSKQVSTAVTVTAPLPPPTQQFYVSPSGNDSDSGTSTSTPWQTIQHAMTNATAGSTVNIMAGTYQEELTMNVSGTPGNYITFQPYNFSVPAGGCGGYTGVTCGGDQVILDYTYLGTNTSQTPLFELGGQSYVRVQGLTFQNFTCFGSLQWGLRIENGASYVEFDYNKFLNLRNIGPFDGTAWLSPIRIGTGSPANNITFIGNEIGNVVTLYSEALTFDGSSVTNGLVQDNYIHDTDGNGATTYNGANNITFRHNKLEYTSIKRDGTVWYNMLRVAIYIDGGGPDIIERNFVNEAGVGFEALAEPGQPAAHDVIIRNNVVENCNAPGAAGIVIGTWYSSTDGSSVYNINVWNNAFYANTDGVVILPMTSASVAWENNIFAGNTNTYINSLNWNPGTVGYNVYFGGGSGPGSNNLTSDPLFVSASTGNFSLLPTSPAIDAGDPTSSATIVGAVDLVGSPRIQGGTIDIGAYEVQ
jgi:hypothetical protein